MSATATTPDASRRDSRVDGLRHRLALTGWSLVYVLLAVPALALLCLVTTALSVAIVGVGLLLLLLLVPLTEQLANVHRSTSGSILGTTISRPYDRPSSGSGLARLKAWAGDPARWRDFGWTWMSVTIGWALAWLGLGLGVLWYLVFPFVWAVTPDGPRSAGPGPRRSTIRQRSCDASSVTSTTAPRRGSWRWA